MESTVNSSSNTNSNSMWQSALDKVKSWLKLPSYNAFRYGMITLYVGTLLMVIGYHNPWMHYSRAFGFSLAIFGIGMIVTAFVKSCKNLSEETLNLGDGTTQVDTLSHRVDSADSKQGLPSYEVAMTTELPTYEEAQALSINPENFVKMQDQMGKSESYPDSPPPSWSPPHALVHPPPECSVTIFNSNEHINEHTNEQIIDEHTNEHIIDEPYPAAQQSTVYQIFGSRSPNRVHPVSNPSEETVVNISNLLDDTRRRRSLISERPLTSTSAIVRSYSSSSFESPDEEDNSSDDWGDSDSERRREIS